MSRACELIVWLLVAGCAQAGPVASNIDANIPIDAAKLTDGPSVDGASGGCASAATCEAAMDLGGVSGDTGNDMVTASGYQSAWFHVRVSENDSNPFGVKLSVTAQLTSPAGAKYDVFLYVNKNNDVIECSQTSGTASTSGATESLRISWGEGTFSNGDDDGRDVSVEVRAPATGCSSSAPWQLQLIGDT